jgi:hypothetical protein
MRTCPKYGNTPSHSTTMSSGWRDICISALISATLLAAIRHEMKKKRSAVLPPGPRPIPIIGNVCGIDIDAPWLTYTEWGEQYGTCNDRKIFHYPQYSPGDIVYSHFFDQEIIVINSEKVAIELLEKRSRNYSDRPKLPTNAL